MPRFDRNQTALVEKLIREQTKNPKIGVVDQVFEHSNSDDDSNWEADVLVDGKTNKLTRVPVQTPGTGTIAPPKNGDKVVVDFVEGQSFKPIVRGNGWSNIDRPPVGRAGIYRNSFEGSPNPSPAGNGDLHITGYTKYDEDVASTDKRELEAEESLVQIAKHTEGANVTPTDLNTIPAKFEMYDSAKNDSSWISVEINKEDNADSDATWGIKFNIKTGEWKLVGPKGFGIESDGEGNFTWHHKSIDFNEVSGSTGPLSL